MKLVSLKYDVCLKELFRNEVVLKYFLSDVLNIPVEKIRSVRMMNTLLWQRYRNQKLGIVDVLVAMNDNTRINIELQVKTSKEWDKRQIFYLSKVYAAELRGGQDYSQLKRCVGIAILDFNLTDREEYHSVYRLRDKGGYDFSDMLELHTLELRKKLPGKDSLEEWIRLFNVETEEELDMIKTDNIGIRQAVKEVRVMSLSKGLRLMYEAHLKEKRDRWAIDAYMKEEAQREGREEGIEMGVKQGMEKGIEKGIEKGRQEGIEVTKKVLKLKSQGQSDTEIARQLDISLDMVRKITD